MTSRSLDRVGEGVGIVVAGALEDHVFEEVGNSRSEMEVLMHTASGHPDLCTDDGGGGIRIENQSEAVRKRFDSGGSSGIFHEIEAWTDRWMAYNPRRCNDGSSLEFWQ
jgi:hypothetical protein